jgi:hypothetical protein
MAKPPSPDARAELVAFLDQEKTRLGEVYRLTERGFDQHQIAAQLGVKTSGFVSNYRTLASTLLDGAIPGALTMVPEAAARIRTILKSQSFSEETRAYLRGLHDDLETAVGNAPKAAKAGKTSASAPVGAGNLRTAVDDALRQRAEQLIDRIMKQAGLDADDYYRLISAGRPLDQLVDLIDRQTSSATSLALFQQRRHELTIEQAAIDWSLDLPLASSLVESARGRVQYWMHE